MCIQAARIFIPKIRLLGHVQKALEPALNSILKEIYTKLYLGVHRIIITHNLKVNAKEPSCQQSRFNPNFYMVF